MTDLKLTLHSNRSIKNDPTLQKCLRILEFCLYLQNTTNAGLLFLFIYRNIYVHTHTNTNKCMSENLISMKQSRKRTLPWQHECLLTGEKGWPDPGRGRRQPCESIWLSSQRGNLGGKIIQNRDRFTHSGKNGNIQSGKLRTREKGERVEANWWQKEGKVLLICLHILFTLSVILITTQTWF